jgi:hypothetical protein
MEKIAPTWYLVTGDPPMWQKNDPEKPGLTLRNDFNDPTGQIDMFDGLNVTFTPLPS